MRKVLGLSNSSNIGEKMNSLIVSDRQKHNGMSWSKPGPVAVEIRLSELEKKVKDKLKPIRDKRREEFWNASSWNLGIAPTWTSETGSTDDLEWSGLSLWTTLAYGFEEVTVLRDTAQIIFHARYRENELFPDPEMEDEFFQQDSYVLALQARVKGPSFGNSKGGPDLNFLFEVSYTNEDRKNRDDEEVFRYIIGAEYRITDDLYLKFSIGTDDGRDDNEDQGFAIGVLKWGFSSPPTF